MLERNVLITWEEVMKHAPTSQTMDKRQIEQSIIIAEERLIRPALGFELYDQLVDSKNVVVTSGNIAALQTLIGSEPTLIVGNVVNAYEQMATANKDLWTKYLWKLTAEAVAIVMYPEGFVQQNAEGLFHKVPPAGLMVTSGLVTPLLSSAKWGLDQKMQNRFTPLYEAMHNFLCKYKTTYVLYAGNCPDCNNEDSVNKGYGGIAMNIYEDTDKPQSKKRFDESSGWC